MKRLLYIALCLCLLAGCSTPVSPSDVAEALSPILSPSATPVRVSPEPPEPSPEASPILPSPEANPSPMPSPTPDTPPAPTPPEPSPEPSLTPEPSAAPEEPNPSPEEPGAAPETPPASVYAAKGSEAPPPAGTIVWRASKDTKVYHSVSACSNMKSPYELSIEEATELGLRPCTKCWSGVG